jgi:hypothetical protein
VPRRDYRVEKGPAPSGDHMKDETQPNAAGCRTGRVGVQASGSPESTSHSHQTRRQLAAEPEVVAAACTDPTGSGAKQLLGGARWSAWTASRANVALRAATAVVPGTRVTERAIAHAGARVSERRHGPSPGAGLCVELVEGAAGGATRRQSQNLRATDLN